MVSFKQFLLEKFELGVQFHTHLNPKLWNDFTLKEDIRTHLLDIASKFIDYLSIEKGAVSDIIITGSNCSFTYTRFSDIDLHLVINEKVICKDCPGDFINDCFIAKKTVWNDNHKIKVKGYDVELYAQPEKDNLVAVGIYSLRKNEWIKKPKIEGKISIDDKLVKNKSQEFMDIINDLISSKSTDENNLNKLKDKIKKYRQSGLEKSGEYSIENVTYKTLRNNGYLNKLYKYIQQVEDKKLSL